MKNVTIPGNVKSIGAGAFSCRSLESINVESGNTVYDSRNNCNAIIESRTNKFIAGCKNSTIPSGIIEIGNAAFRYSSSLTSISIPNSVAKIGSSAFEYCSSLTSVRIPGSVTSITNNPFEGCSDLSHIYVEESNSVYDSRDNCNGIIETKTNTFVVGCKCSFIPSSVTSMGNSAFSHCEDINSFYTGDNVSTIEKSAFSYCSGLEYVVIGKRVTSIEGSAFAHCTELTDIYCYAESVPSLQTTSFTSSLIENATLHVPASSISAYSSDKRWKKFGRIVALTDNDPQASGIHQPRLNTNNVSTYWYDLKGHQFMNEPTQKGIYIHNGKVVKK
ncbi:MAG: leucine-rich repeat domain-containing protein [Prevotella sp.]|nr:leucine-rich repeat domain-containing protein [Prevotella sp.]